MKLYLSMMSYFSKRKKDEDVQAPEGRCPNCWGIQDHDGTFREIFKDKQVAVNIHGTKDAFVRDVAANNMDGIQPKTDSTGVICEPIEVRH